MHAMRWPAVLLPIIAVDCPRLEVAPFHDVWRPYSQCSPLKLRGSRTQGMAFRPSVPSMSGLPGDGMPLTLVSNLPKTRYFSTLPLVPGEGLEPPTFGLQNRCTTAVLTRHINGLAAT
jgi:hypothetical protein